VARWEAAAWYALAVEALAESSGTVGSTEGHHGNNLAQEAAAIVPAAASHESVEAWHSLWGTVAAGVPTAEGGKVEVLWQKGSEMAVPQSTGPELVATRQKVPEPAATQAKVPEPAATQEKVPEPAATQEKVPWKEALSRRIRAKELKRRRVPAVELRWRRCRSAATVRCRTVLEAAVRWRKVSEAVVRRRRGPEAARGPCTHPLPRAARPRTAAREEQQPAGTAAGRTGRPRHRGAEAE
jgi:hypothetical protein